MSANPPVPPKVPFTKPPLRLEAQVQRLADRGLIIRDRSLAESYLRVVNYYRLTPYWLPFQIAPNTFRAGTTFEMVRGLYEFDYRPRMLVVEALETIEIALRSAIAYHMAHLYGPFGHTVVTNFSAGFQAKHEEWLAHVHEETTRSNEKFVQHFEQRHLEYPQLPIWSAVEIMTIGTVSKMFGGLKGSDQTAIASQYRVHGVVLSSWVHTLVYIRNICAHHARLWSQELRIAPKLPRHDPRWEPVHVPHYNRLGAVLFMINTLTGPMASPRFDSADWRRRVEGLLASNPGIPTFKADMGLPAVFPTHPLWN